MSEVFEKTTEDAHFSWGKHENQAIVAFSLRGKSHAKTDMPLQDNHTLRILPNGWSLAVICDGVGSKIHADKGARTAANAFADFVVRFLGSYQDAESIRILLISAAHYATGKIKDEAQQREKSIHDYNTTLHAVIFANGIIYYLHSGDGGIVALTEDGTFELLTTPQKEEEYVIPLLSGPDRWETGQSKGRVQSVLLCTDGVYDKISGSILRKYGDGIDKGICTYFLSPWCFDSWDHPEKIAEQMSQIFTGQATPNDFYQTVARGIAQGKTEDEDKASVFVLDWIYSDNYPLSALQGIQDDITVALVQNVSERPCRQNMDYFKGPDWNTIQQNVYQTLYGSGA